MSATAEVCGFSSVIFHNWRNAIRVLGRPERVLKSIKVLYLIFLGRSLLLTTMVLMMMVIFSTRMLPRLLI